ncbi:MAG: ASKHA domain-containing protein [Lachnospiraceae bacterium]|nr:ASKHA domain-containing protein [Lachnospiraceae bacterium]
MILHAQKGSDISALLKNAGFPFLCGGTGSCGKCRIRVLSGEVSITDADRTFFSEEELKSGMRLACMAGTAGSDLEIEYELPDEDIYIPTDTCGGKYESGRMTGSSDAESKTDLADTGPAAFDIAIDIGTTTIAAAAVDRYTGRIIAVRTGINHQRSFGADVISRIVASNLGSGPKMRDAVITDINALIEAIMTEHALTAAGLGRIVIAGNTTMQHIFAGYSCEGLGTAPFTPVSTALTDTPSGLLLPGISAFVGADIVAGIYSCGFGDDLSLLIDLGTNGELALGTKDRILVASTAAGPAFEGGNISCGTAGIPGAICDVTLCDEDGKEPIVLKLIGGAEKPVGICGTGVIALVAELIKQGLVDETGLLDERLHGRIRLSADGKVTFTQKDIRELQLASAAVRGGIETLLDEYGAAAGDIKHVYIAGGFGTELDPDKAVTIGLLPKELSDKCESVGNSSLSGAVKYASDPKGAEALDNIVKVSREIILADSEAFKAHFMEHMNFAHL